MGKRKAKKKAETKKKPTLPSSFKCPFCGSSASCEVELAHKSQTAKIECRVCHEGFQCRMNHLTEPIDVFYEWVDACDAAAAAGETGGAAGGDEGAGVARGGGGGLGDVGVVDATEVEDAGADDGGLGGLGAAVAGEDS